MSVLKLLSESTSHQLEWGTISNPTGIRADRLSMDLFATQEALVRKAHEARCFTADRVLKAEIILH